jgi:F-type H+-transporting ATPase subunit b
MPFLANTLQPVLAAGLMDMKPGLVLWTGITFLILLVLLSRFAWGPIVKMLNEREKTISEAIEQAKKERAEAERLLAEQKEHLAQAQRDAAELAKRNKQEVEAARVELTARARQEAAELVASARKQIEEEKTQVAAQLKREAVDLAILAAGRLIEASLDDKAQRALVEECIAHLPTERPG